MPCKTNVMRCIATLCARSVQISSQKPATRDVDLRTLLYGTQYSTRITGMGPAKDFREKLPHRKHIKFLAAEAKTSLRIHDRIANLTTHTNDTAIGILDELDAMAATSIFTASMGCVAAKRSGLESTLNS